MNIGRSSAVVVHFHAAVIGQFNEFSAHTDINFQGLSDYENSTTRRTPTSVTSLFDRARFIQHFYLFFVSISTKPQNPPRVQFLNRKWAISSQRTYVATNSILIGLVHPHHFWELPSVSMGLSRCCYDNSCHSNHLNPVICLFENKKNIFFPKCYFITTTLTHQGDLL